MKKETILSFISSHIFSKVKLFLKQIELDKNSEYIADYYESKCEYSYAAYYRRNYLKKFNGEIEELKARILDIKAMPSIDDNETQRYIEVLIDAHEELSNIGNYLLSIYFRTVKKSIFLEYKRLNLIKLYFNDDISLLAIQRILEILKNTENARKALRKINPYKKKSHANLLIEERAEKLLKSIPILTCKKQGYLIWEDILTTLNDSVWLGSIKQIFIEKIKNWHEHNLTNLINKSFVKKINEIELTEDINAINSLKAIKFMMTNKPKKFAERSIKLAIYIVEQQGTTEEKYWGRYYLAVYYSLIGEHQLANNHASTLLELCAYDDNDSSKKMAAMLGLISWGISQYRLGNKVEGICCIISGFDLAYELEEISPVIEDGFNIIIKYINDCNIHKTNEKDIQPFICEISQHTGNGMVNYGQIFNDFGTIYNELKEKIYNPEVENVDWATLLVSYIDSCLKLNKQDEAINLIIKNYKKLIPLLELRMDLRGKILKHFAEILLKLGFKDQENPYFPIILELLEIASDDCEKRRNLNYRTERGYVNELNKEINTYYLHILVLIYMLEYKSEEKKRQNLLKIEIVLSRIAPRALIEEKYHKLQYKRTKEMDELEQKYRELTEISLSQYISNPPQEIIKEQQALYDKLIELHPDYMPLKNYKGFKFEEIQKKLGTKDAVYQYIITRFGIVYIFVTNKEISISFAYIDNTKNLEIEKSLNILDMAIQKDNSNVINLCKHLSHIFYPKLLEYLDNNTLNKLYIVKTDNFHYFCPNLLYKNDWMIKKINSIQNIVDYNVIDTDDNITNQKSDPKILIKVFGKSNDCSIKLINQEIAKLQNNTDIVYFSNENNEKLQSLYEKLAPDILIIFAHGVPAVGTNYNEGSHYIESNEKEYSFEDILNETQNIPNLIFLSCKSGISQKEQTETSYGIWSSVLKNPIKNIILGRWDIPTKQAINLAKYIIQNCKSNTLSKILIEMQKESIDNILPSEWGGFEFWKNL